MATKRIASEGRRLARPAAQVTTSFSDSRQIDDDALVSLFDCHTKTPAGSCRFCANFSTGRPCGGWAEVRRFQSVDISYASKWNDAARVARLTSL